MKKDFLKMVNSVNETWQYGFTDTDDGTYIYIENGSRTTYLDMPAYSIFAVLDNEEPENGKVNVYRLIYAEKDPGAKTDAEKFDLGWYPDAIDVVGTVNVADLKRV